ncbi:MAG: hypothetical protein AAB632_02365 [Patescibacteria group bacterium]
MDKKVRNKKKQKKGETFYEAISATAVATQEISLPKVSAKTADFLESVVIFFAGTALVLILMRVVLMVFGINGGNLLTYLLYAASYPFVLILNSSQSQIPASTNATLYENIAIIMMYSIIFYGILRIIKALRAEESNN